MYKHYHPIPPWARQHSQAVASLLKRWGAGPSPPGLALLMWADRDGWLTLLPLTCARPASDILR